MNMHQNSRIILLWTPSCLIFGENLMLIKNTSTFIINHEIENRHLLSFVTVILVLPVVVVGVVVVGVVVVGVVVVGVVVVVAETYIFFKVLETIIL